MALCWDPTVFDSMNNTCMVMASVNGVADDAVFQDLPRVCRTAACVDYFHEFKRQVKRKCEAALSLMMTPGNDRSRNPGLCDDVSTNRPLVRTTPTHPFVPIEPPGVGYGASSTLVILLALVATFCFIFFVCFCAGRTKRLSTPHQPSTQAGQAKATADRVELSPFTTRQLATAFSEFSQLTSPRRTADAASTSAALSLWTHASITTNRIPLEKVHLGPCISHGGYGEVCIGTYNNSPVAIKRLLPMRRKDPESIASFLSEIQLTSTLDHACIVTFIGVAWDAPSDLCMVSEFISGGDMRSYLSGRASNSQGFDDDKLRIAVCVAHALTYLHSLQPVFVHRDLKSRNILLTQKPELHAKLMDFGVSCDRRDTTMTAGVGTSLWMAPEVMLGERYNEKADVFSFGVVLSELDTHELPYAQAKDPNSDRKMSEMVLMQRVVSGSLKPSFSSKADPEIVALADECLQLDPNLRPSAAVVLYRIHKNQFALVQ